MERKHLMAMGVNARRWARIGMLATLAGILTVPPQASPWPASMAWADDDDGGDDDGGGGGGAGTASPGSSGSSTGSASGSAPRFLKRFFNKQPVRKKRPAQARKAKQRPVARQAAPVVQFRAREIVAIGLLPADLAELTARGYEIAQQVTVSALDAEMVRLTLPRGVGLEQARADVRSVNLAALADFNHFYRPQQEVDCTDAACAAWKMLSWPVAATAANSCGGDVRIGMVDTRVNAEHDALKGARISIIDTLSADGPDASAGHGTAVAALLVGSRESRTPGLLPSAQLFAADPFTRSGGGDLSDVFSIVAAIDRIAAKNVHVLNLSFAGPENVLLQRIVSIISAKGTPIVAAAGNAGSSSPPLFPAAYPETMAVTAVDRNKNVYRRAVKGEHIDFAAPGVNVWAAASVSGGRAKTGTSFATPFVAAAAALLKARSPGLTPEQIVGILSKSATDLGEAEKDNVFGHGLVQTSGLCSPPGEAAAPVSVNAPL
jgi:subtilisin family serine protease